MSELLDCPFCGTGRSYYSGLRTVRSASELYRGLTDFWIECPGCGATGPARRADHTEERSAELAAERWNRRAEPGWQPISSAPRDGTKIDLWGHWPEHDRWERSADVWWSEVEGDWRIEDHYLAQMFTWAPLFTHWRPIIGPPVEAASPAHAELSPGNSSDLRGEEG